MAYMSQEKKKEILNELRPLFKKYGVKASIAVVHHSTLRLNIYSSPVDFLGDYNQILKGKSCDRDFQEKKNHLDVNPYWYAEHFSGVALEFLKEAMQVMNKGNHDNSDSMIDYFDVGWYVDINIGTWNKPYIQLK